jgi:CelD/BcsL family acetyltransferase involved in cellulose biosynthesis
MSRYRLGRNLFVKQITELTPDEMQAWDQLVSTEADLRRAFMSRAYVAAVAETGADVCVLVGHEEGRAVFFLPLQRQHGLAGKMGCHEPVGGAMTDYFGVVATAQVRLDVSAVLAATRGRVSLCTYTHLDESQARFGLTADEHRIGLQTDLGVEPDKFWSRLRELDKKLVTDTERRERKLRTDCGDIEFEWQTTQPETDLAWLIECKKQQYSRTGRELAPLFEQRNVDLLYRLLNSQSDMCSGVLSVLRSPHGVIAGHFGLRCQGVLHVWFPVFDRAYAHASPGRILFKHMFAAAPQHQVQMFDRGEGDTPAKRDFANTEHRFGRGVWRARGWRGELGLLAQRLAWRFKL